ncbi:MAG: hypothetical protein WC817_02755 [Patescibacteria group bacterium]|jgi:hypothetical protein
MLLIKKRKQQHPLGVSLFEVVIYVAFFLVLTILITNVSTQLIAVNQNTRATNDIIASARFAVDTIAQEVRHAKSVYSPTSVFDVSPGQLSLETTRDLPDGETSTFVDFYIDTGRLYLRREGQDPIRLTSDSVIVEGLTFSYLNQSVLTPAVRMSITVANYGASSGNVSHRTITLVTTAALRSYAQ